MILRVAKNEGVNQKQKCLTNRSHDLGKGVGIQPTKNAGDWPKWPLDYQKKTRVQTCLEQQSHVMCLFESKWNMLRLGTIQRHRLSMMENTKTSRNLPAN